MMFWGQGPWTVDIEIAQKWSIGTPSQNLKIFQILRFLTKYHGLKLMKMTKIYDFWKNFVIEKFENWMDFDQNSLTVTHETAKYDKKIQNFHRKFYDVADP